MSATERIRRTWLVVRCVYRGLVKKGNKNKIKQIRGQAKSVNGREIYRMGTIETHMVIIFVQ